MTQPTPEAVKPLEIEAEIARPTEVFYAKVGEEIIKREIPFINDVLRQLVTLTVSLLGGGIFFLSADNCDRRLRGLGSSFFMGNLNSGVVGNG